MDKIQALVAYICMNTPNKSNLSKSRVTKMVYLADWVSSLVDGKQLTSIEWHYNHKGPYVDDVLQAIKDSPYFMLASLSSLGLYSGGDSTVVMYMGNSKDIPVSPRDIQVLDIVIKKTQSMLFNEFTDYIYSTYPVTTKERYTTLNLPELASEYHHEYSPA